MDAGSQQFLGSPDSSDGAGEAAVELIQIAGSTVGQRGIALAPDELGRIEFRRVGGEPLHMDSRTLRQIALDLLAPVDSAAIPQEDDGPPEMPEQMLQERDDMQAREVVATQPDIQADASAVWGNAERIDGRDLVLSVEVVQLRRLSAKRPSALNVRDEQEPTFVEEDQMGSQRPGFFLSAANPAASTGRWPLRFAEEPAVRASGSLSPGRSAVSRRGSGDRIRRSASEEPDRSSPASTGRSSTRRPAALRPKGSVIAPFGDPRADAGVRKPGGDAILASLAAGSFATSGRRNLLKRLTRARRPADSVQSLVAEWRAGAAAPSADGFQRVSCSIR